MATSSSQTYPQDLRLHHYPDPVLRRPCEAVTVFDAELRAFAERLLAAMHEERGVGLAAPQVGVSRRIFVTDHGSAEQLDPRIWINPRIEKPDGETIYEEGCLSFPGIYAKVKRHNRFTFVHQDLDGTEHRTPMDVEAGDFLGIVVQHELDHLDGIVFVDHLSPLQLTMQRRRLKELEKEFKKQTGKAGALLRR